MRAVKARDYTGTPNTLRFVYDDHGQVHVELTAKHDGTIVVSKVTMPRVVFVEHVRELGVL